MASNNAYKRLGAVRPADTNEAKLYGPATDTSAVVTVSVCNQDSIEHTYRIAVTNTDAAADGEDWIAYDTTILANMTHSVSGICITNPETIRVRSSVADLLSFVAYGLELS